MKLQICCRRALALCFSLLFPLRASAAPVEVRLAEDGRALIPVVIVADAPPGVRTAADTLAQHLTRITGGEFKVETAAAGNLEPDTKGIAVGLAADFPALAVLFKPDDPTRTEDYL